MTSVLEVSTATDSNATAEQLCAAYHDKPAAIAACMDRPRLTRTRWNRSRTPTRAMRSK
ncbi:MAG TPA: hypothetical protein VFC19_35360 [Candidatus Limnocylindrales bacterium]|nr:hypothetical protein [Candidatus Limnocylindrales bacterium]